MSGISLDGKVALVTGAGRGLGREYALALAGRGASVLVNDLGTALDGTGRAPEVAEEVAALIRANGGVAAANGDDVTSVAGASAMIAQAVENFGALDIVINNAGICRDLPFEDCAIGDFEFYWRVHLAGHVNVTAAAWPIMKAAGSGRIVMTGSGAGLFGLANEAAYAAAKGAVHGLMRTLAREGAAHGIRVNAIYPGGVSRMHEEAFPDPAVLAMMRGLMPPELVAPAIVWLASDACEVTGQALSVWGGRIARIVIGSGRGYIDRALTPESIAAHWNEIASPEGLFEPDDGIADVAHWQGALTGDQEG